MYIFFSHYRNENLRRSIVTVTIALLIIFITKLFCKIIIKNYCPLSIFGVKYDPEMFCEIHPDIIKNELKGKRER